MPVAIIRRLFSAALSFAFAPAAFAATVAFVTDVQGEAKRSGAGKVDFLSEIASDTKLTLAKGARVSLMYTASGTEFVLTGAGEFLVEAGEVRATSGAAPMRRAVAVRPDPIVIARVSQAATASVRMRSAAPAAPKPGPVYPRDAQIATLQPSLRWTGEAGKDSVDLVVSTADGKEVWKGSAKASPLLLPVKLAPATRYSWSVSSGGRSYGEAPFETLGAEPIARADKSRASAKGFSERVVHALVLQDIGATADAREAWAELARERPELGELAVLAR